MRKEWGKGGEVGKRARVSPGCINDAAPHPPCSDSPPGKSLRLSFSLRDAPRSKTTTQWSCHSGERLVLLWSCPAFF
eukprot:3199953-Pyramimonas_sp.AAC.1